MLYKWAANIHKDPLKQEDINEMKNWAESITLNPALHKLKYTTTKFYGIIVVALLMTITFAYITYKPTVADENNAEVEIIEEEEEGASPD